MNHLKLASLELEVVYLNEAPGRGSRRLQLLRHQNYGLELLRKFRDME